MRKGYGGRGADGAVGGGWRRRPEPGAARCGELCEPYAPNFLVLLWIRGNFMDIKLSDHFTFGRLIRFTMPSIGMMVFTSIYGVVDGLFVSNFVGKTAFAGLNLIMPVIMMLSSVGFMLGTGGTALVARFLGENDRKRANETFSLLVYFLIGLGVVISAAAMIFMRRIAIALGADGELLENAVIYGRILCGTLTLFMLQTSFQTFLIAAERPTMGFALTVSAGVTNMALDALFVAVFKWGLVGAALATCMSQVVGGFVPLIYFSSPNKSLLHLGKAKWNGVILFKTFTNGSSELLSNIAMSVVSILYNFQLIRFAGENGIAAYGCLMYVGFIFAAVFLGWGIGTSPIVSYNYGAENRAELHNLFVKNLVAMGVFGLVLFAAAEMLSFPFAKLFTGYDAELFELTRRAFHLYSFSFLLTGFNMFGSSFFTALNNGFVSALISFMRTMVFQVACVLVLPVLWGIDGIWLSGIIYEVLSAIVVAVCLAKFKNRYGY